MKQELKTRVMQCMLPYLDNAQLKQLEQVMDQILFHYEVSNVQLKENADDNNEINGNLAA